MLVSHIWRAPLALLAFFSCLCSGLSAQTSIASLTFDDATSADAWTAVADAASAEASIGWNATGVSTGALELSATNTAEVGRAYIFQYLDGAVDYGGATDVQLSFDIKAGSPLVGAAVHLQTEFPGVGTVNTFDLQTQGINESTWTTLTYDFTGISTGSIFRIHFNMAAGAFAGAGGTLLIDNITLTGTDNSGSGGGDPVATAPTDNAADPTADAADVISIYGDSYTSIATNLNPGWGQSGTVTADFDPGTGNTVMLYSNFNYQGTDLTATDASGKTHLHIDVWVAEGTNRLLKVTPVNNGGGAGEFLVSVPLTPGSWNSVDLAKSDFTGMTWDNVFQLKFDGQFNADGSANTTPYDVYLDNIYFHGTDTGGGDTGGGDGGGDPATVEVTINVNMQNETTSTEGVYIAGGLDFGVPGTNAMSDADGDDIWTITFTLASGYTGNYTITNGACGDWSCKENIGGQDCADGPYNDRLLSNITEDTTINTCFGECSTDGTCTTAPPPPPASGPTDNAAAPTQDAANVASIFSDSYTDIATNYNPFWGQSGASGVNPAFDPGTGNLVLAYPNFNYQGTELPATDLSEMGYLHVDVWVEAGTDRLLKVTPVNNGDGGTGAGEFLVNVPLTPGAWSSVDLPRSAFTGMTWDNVFQMKFDGQFNGDGSANGTPYDVYLDNIYFWKDPAAAIAGCMDPAANNYNSAATEDDNTCSYDVTFRVDMNAHTGTFGVVNINGSFNGWCGGCNPLTDADLDGVWEVTLPLTEGTIEYKFTLDGWTAQEEFQPGGPCTSTIDGYTNRTLTIDGDEDLAVVCYNSCSACAVVTGCTDSAAINYSSEAAADDGSCLYPVTFQVDMSQYGLAAGDIVYTNGAYNSWCGDCNPMADADGDGIWTGTFNLTAGQQEYKFTVNGWNVSEQFDGSESCTTAPAEYVNRVASITGATTLPVVCWNSCDICYDINNTTAGTGHTTIQDAIDAASAGDVISLAAGTFNPSGQITVNKALSLTGAGSGSTTIQAGGTGYGMSISADDVHLEGFTLDGAATFGVKASGVSNFSLQDVAAINGNNSAIDLNGVNGATLTDISASNTALGYGLAIASSSDVTVNGITTSSNAFGAIGIFPAQTQYQASGLEAPSNISIGGSVSLNGGAGAVTVQNGALASGGIWVGTVSNDAADNADVTVPVGFTHAVFSTRNDGLTGQSIASQAVIAGLVAYGAANPIPGVTYEDVYVYDMVEGDYEVFAPLLIQDALDAASAGDAITVADGTYAVETPILVNKAVTLQGQSEAGVLLECGAGLGGANSIQVTAGATLKDFTLNANSFATFGIHVQPGTANATLSGLTITNTASNGIGLSGVTDATVSDIAGSGNVQYVLGIAGSVGVTASDISGGNVGVYKGTGTYAQSATDIEFTGTFDLSGGFVIEQLAGADEITYSIDGSAADVKIPAAFDRVFFADYTSVPLPPPYNEASLATLVEADKLATAIATAQALDAYGYGLEDAAVYNLTAAQWEVSAGLSIQDAIDRAAAGDVIDIAEGTYEEDLALNKGVTLNGPNAGIAHDGARGAEAIIDGEHTLSASAAVTLDGLQFLSNNPAQTSTIYVSIAAGHAIQNNRFVSSIAGGNTGGNHDLAIYTAVLSTGTMTISGNSFSGDGSFTDGDRYSTAAWGRGIWLNGGGAAVTIAGNAFTNCRTGINLENYDNSACSVDGNTLTDCGTGLALGVPTAGDITSIINNGFQDVDTDINARNLTADISWNLAATGNTAIPGNSTVYSDLGYIPGNSPGDIDDPNGSLAYLSGSGADHLTFGAEDNTVTGDYGGAANDYLDGGDGTDGAQYGDSQADASMVREDDRLIVTTLTAGVDTLVNMEFVTFSDGVVSLSGCTFPDACNFLAYAMIDDGSCEFASCSGCRDEDACNFDATATLDGPLGTCTYPGLYQDCSGNCINDANANGICDELDAIGVDGCTDPAATNYNPDATNDDGSCYTYTLEGCLIPSATNYDPTVNVQGEPISAYCIFPWNAAFMLPSADCADLFACNYDATATGYTECDYCLGCTDNGACNYDNTAFYDDGSCTYVGCSGCTNSCSSNYDAAAVIDDGSCNYANCGGCTDSAADNYDAGATIDDGSCQYAGCTYPAACNFDPTANVNDGSCSLLSPAVLDAVTVVSNATALNVADGEISVSFSGGTATDIVLSGLNGSTDYRISYPGPYNAIAAGYYAVSLEDAAGCSSNAITVTVLYDLCCNCGVNDADTDGICDDADNCTDKTASNFADPANEACTY